VLIDSAGLLAEKYNISKAIIGLTVVAFGTSLPEFIVSMAAIYNGEMNFVIGNILGSNIANIGLVLGISSLFYKLSSNFKEMKLDVVFLSITSLIFSVILYYNMIEKLYGIILLLLFCLYMYILFNSNKTNINTAKSLNGNTHIPQLTTCIFIGSLGLSVGSQLLIDGSIGIAKLFGISHLAIGATVIALGTSLPELATSLNAARKNEFGLLLGNIFGSNIINIAFVFGISLIANNNIHTVPKIPDYHLVIFSLITLTFFVVLMNRIIDRFYSVLLLSIYTYYIFRIL